MKLYNITKSNGHDKFEYKEEQKGNIIEVTLKLTIDTNWKSERNYIEKCEGKKCLASKTIRDINKDIREENKRNE